MTTLEEVRARFARDRGLPFADSLSERSILKALNDHGVTYRDRLFNPVTTIWGFLSQVLSESRGVKGPPAGIAIHPEPRQGPNGRPPRAERPIVMLATFVWPTDARKMASGVK
jgi:hypothetical protein